MSYLYRKLLLIVLIGIIVLLYEQQTCIAQVPSWVCQEGKLTYPEGEFITGFAELKKRRKESSEEFEKKLKLIARTELIEEISLTLISKSIYIISENNGVVTQTYNQKVDLSSESNLLIPVEYYFNPKDKHGYAIAHLNKKETSSKLESIIYNHYDRLEMVIKQADQLADNTMIDLAFEKYQLAKEIISKIQMLEMDYIYFNKGESINSYKYGLSGINSNIDQKIYFLKKKPANSIDDFCCLIYINLKGESINKDLPILINRIKLNQSNTISDFSEIFHDMLLGRLNNHFDNEILGHKTLADHYELDGEYWINNDNINILLKLYTILNSKKSMSQIFEVKIDKSYLLKNGINFETQRYDIVPDSIISRNGIKYFNIRGLYCDKTGELNQYIRIKDFKQKSKNHLSIEATYMKGGLQKDINILLNISTNEVDIPKVGKGILELTANPIFAI